MSQFSFKFKQGSLELELSGEYSEVIEAFNLVMDKSSTKPIIVTKESPNQIEEDINQNEKETPKKRKTKSSKSGVSKIEFTQLDDKFMEIEFIEEFRKINPSGDKNKILIAALLYSKQTSKNDFSINELHTLLDKVAVDTPKNMRAMMTNYINRDKLIERIDADNFKWKHIGKQKIQDYIDKQMSSLNEDKTL